MSRRRLGGADDLTLVKRAAEIAEEPPLRGMTPLVPPVRHDPCSTCGAPTLVTALRTLPGDRLRRCATCLREEKRRRGLA